MSKRGRQRSGLVKYFDDLTEELRTQLSNSLRSDVQAIHDARVATRRLRAVVTLFEGHLSRKLRQRFAGGLKRVRRTLGRVRDLDVIGEKLGEFGASHAEAAAFVLEHVKQERQVQLAKIEALNAAKLLGRLGSWWGLCEQVAGESAKSLLYQALRSQLESFCELAGRFATPEKNYAQQPFTAAVNAHQLRISGKALRYMVEMALADGAPVPLATGRVFKRIQALLGEWHDLAILADKVLETSLKAQLSYSNSALFLKCLKLSQAAIHKAEGRLTSFAKLWREKGEELQRQIQFAIEAHSPSLFAEDAANTPETKTSGKSESAPSEGLEQ